MFHLCSKIQSKFIMLLGNHVKSEILRRIKEAK